jgi:hypothetical protein
MHMTSSPKGAAFIPGASSGVGAVYAEHPAHQGLDRRRRPPDSPEVTTLNRSDQSLAVTAKKPFRILLVDAALALHESHLSLLRAIPATVKTLTCCADMYVHREHDYVLVILVLPSESRETAEAAQFVRRRWSTARILLLEGEAATIDDWLYDERVDPRSHPATLREAAIRLMTEEKYWASA